MLVDMAYEENYMQYKPRYYLRESSILRGQRFFSRSKA